MTFAPPSHIHSLNVNPIRFILKCVLGQRDRSERAVAGSLGGPKTLPSDLRVGGGGETTFRDRPPSLGRRPILLGLAVQSLYQAAIFGDSPFGQFHYGLPPISGRLSVGRSGRLHTRLSDALNRHPKCFRNILVIDSSAKAVRRFFEVHVYCSVDKISVYA